MIVTEKARLHDEKRGRVRLTRLIPTEARQTVTSVTAQSHYFGAHVDIGYIPTPVIAVIPWDSTSRPRYWLRWRSLGAATNPTSQTLIESVAVTVARHSVKRGCSKTLAKETPWLALKSTNGLSNFRSGVKSAARSEKILCAQAKQ